MQQNNIFEISNLTQQFNRNKQEFEDLKKLFQDREITDQDMRNFETIESIICRLKLNQQSFVTIKGLFKQKKPSFELTSEKSKKAAEKLYEKYRKDSTLGNTFQKEDIKEFIKVVQSSYLEDASEKLLLLQDKITQNREKFNAMHDLAKPDVQTFLQPALSKFEENEKGVEKILNEVLEKQDVLANEIQEERKGGFQQMVLEQKGQSMLHGLNGL